MAEEPLKDPANDPAEVQLPLWFRDDDHLVTGAGIVRRSDHALLDEEGLPQSLALRGAEERALAEAKAAQKAEAAAAKQTKKEAADAGK